LIGLHAQAGERKEGADGMDVHAVVAIIIISL
jgi:hypothetical protein